MQQSISPVFFPPEKYVKNDKELEDLQCGICLESTLRPVKCAGGCEKIYCLDCYSKWRREKNQCPVRCCKEFVLQPPQEVNISFHCPFAPDKCKTDINNLREFQEHVRNCSLSPESFQLQKQYTREYKCKIGHKLQLLYGTFQQKSASLCGLCGETRPALYVCRPCGQKYCTRCRKPNFSKTICSQGHEFKEIKDIKDVGYQCTNCGYAPVFKGQGCYHDIHCLYDLCPFCQKQFPEEKTENKFLINDPKKCSKDHILIYIGKKKKATCSSCLKEKFCKKTCKPCKQFFCFDCKIPEIDFKGKCQSHHRFQFWDQRARPAKKELCMKCGQVQWKCNDRKCNIRLCLECYQYCSKVVAENDRQPIPFYCTKGHSLKYIHRSPDKKGMCCTCQRFRTIKFECWYCNRMKYFCAECIMPPVGKCYKDHQLIDWTLEAKCSMCSRTSKENKICADCDFKLCNHCQKKVIRASKKPEDRSSQSEDIPEDVSASQISLNLPLLFQGQRIAHDFIELFSIQDSGMEINVPFMSLGQEPSSLQYPIRNIDGSENQDVDERPSLDES